ncbi:MAG: cryptochrome/photolyase family protein, partial [Cyanobacteria bacterium P01_H01_bin.152]
MTTGVWVLGDQLYAGQTALAHQTDHKTETPVLMIESRQHVQQRRYHAQKLVLVWSAMRHFAAELKDAGWTVNYAIAENFETPLRQWIQEQGITTLQIMEPSDRPFLTLLQKLALPCKLDIIPNNHFLWSVDDFNTWASKRK